MKNDRAILSQVTAIIKTFERPKSVDRLIRSIRRHYPELKIMVGDDSFHPTPRSDVQYVRLPEDIGLSAGRNELLKRVETPFFLLLDDDLEFHRGTRIERLAHLASRHDFAVAAGNFIRCKW